MLAITIADYCVMVIVRAAVWLVAPVPLVEAISVILLDPGGVPDFDGLLLLPHEARPTANSTRAHMLYTRDRRSAGLSQTAVPKTIPKGRSRA